MAHDLQHILHTRLTDWWDKSWTSKVAVWWDESPPEQAGSQTSPRLVGILQPSKPQFKMQRQIGGWTWVLNGLKVSPGNAIMVTIEPPGGIS